jgi:hypothetical protein
VVINGNITYGSGYTGASNAPNFTLVVRGNVYIAPNVTQIDGLLIAESYIGGGGNQIGGTIYTCANGASPVSGNNTHNICANNLTFNGAVIAKDMKLLRTKGTLSYGTNPQNVDHLNLVWSSNGVLPGRDCLQIQESLDSAGTWQDNYLCGAVGVDITGSNSKFGLRWTQNGPTAPNPPRWDEFNGIFQIGEWPQDPSDSTNIRNRPSTIDPNQDCVLFHEPGEPNTQTIADAQTGWHNNYLCYNRIVDGIPRELRFYHGGNDPAPLGDPNWNCISLNEPSDQDTWGDNYLCEKQYQPIDPTITPGDDNIAEIFRFDPTLYLNPSFRSDIQRGSKYEFITNAAPIF